MNATSLVRLSAVALVLVITAVGCKKRPERVTSIPGLRPGGIGESLSGPLNVSPTLPTTGPGSEGFPLAGNLSTWTEATEQPFRADTVYFDFDKASVKASELPKIERVMAGMKSHPGKALRIAGHCDERGTEEYNRALGERRALAVRERLITLGMESGMVDTISYGEDRPVEPGHDSAAWSRNRRAEFILLEPPRSASAQ